MLELAKVPYVSLPNLLTAEPLVPELIQGEATAANLSQAVIELLENYKERKQRARKWVPLKVALENVFEPELKQILRNFNPKMLLNSKYLK